MEPPRWKSALLQPETDLGRFHDPQKGYHSKVTVGDRQAGTERSFSDSSFLSSRNIIRRAFMRCAICFFDAKVATRLWTGSAWIDLVTFSVRRYDGTHLCFITPKSWTNELLKKFNSFWWISIKPRRRLYEFWNRNCGDDLFDFDELLMNKKEIKKGNIGEAFVSIFQFLFKPFLAYSRPVLYKKRK